MCPMSFSFMTQRWYALQAWRNEKGMQVKPATSFKIIYNINKQQK